MDKTKSLTSEERWEGSKLINGGAAHPIRLAFCGEGNGPVTLGTASKSSSQSVYFLLILAYIVDFGL